MNAPASKDAATALAHLKDFQRATVEHVFRRMYLDPAPARRFLVADEVGLGKTLVARGLIARVIDHLRGRTERIDIIYVCSNADIARQNIDRLGVPGSDHLALSTRITLLPLHLRDGEESKRAGPRGSKVNFVSFTPGTSFDLKDSTGVSKERELLYWLLDEAWSTSFAKATCVLTGYARIKEFRGRVNAFPSDPANRIHEGMKAAFLAEIGVDIELRDRYLQLCEDMPRAGATVPAELVAERNAVVGELRKRLAQTCLRWLEPDLVILDEFQRFRHLLATTSEEQSDAAQLAAHLFNYQDGQADPATAARVLLLSATPYRMYTRDVEAGDDDHYVDFQRTLDFLLPDAPARSGVRALLRSYREALYRLPEQGAQALAEVKGALEDALRRVMVRTERLAVTANRSGMLAEVPAIGLELTADDVRNYLTLQQIARELGYGDVVDYWASAPYLLNFMEDYELKRKLNGVIARDTASPSLVRAFKRAGGALLERTDLEHYKAVDPGNARMRAVVGSTIGKGVWQLLWMPPALPYYMPQGPYGDPVLQGFTKRLVFSCWKVVPKAIASLLSYEAERRMIRGFNRKAMNTKEARPQRPLLRFSKSKGRLTGMPALALVYPARMLASCIDPLSLLLAAGAATPPGLDEVLKRCEEVLREPLERLVRTHARRATGPTDEAWYWAAPLLLDAVEDGDALQAWMESPTLPATWRGAEDGKEDREAARAWAEHIREARALVSGRMQLGPPPSNLGQVLARVALASPGVVAMRALARVAGNGAQDLRTAAAPLAYAFLSLFNLPEATALLRARYRQEAYWSAVLSYCADGNLQSVMDEYVHVLVESLGVLGKSPDEIARKVSEAARAPLQLRTGVAQADLLRPGHSRVCGDDQIRLRTRFAMRFGDQPAEDTDEPTRADHVRGAFNSPFWPFVLATTSIGQEGLDFHPYCHAVVHWNLPHNPVDLEQREGRVHRYKGHAVRRNLARAWQPSSSGSTDPWNDIFESARRRRGPGENDLYPYWVAPDGDARIERHVLALPESRDARQQVRLREALVLYRMVFGQNRQEDLVAFLSSRLGGSAEELLGGCRIDLAPPGRSA